MKLNFIALAVVATLFVAPVTSLALNRVSSSRSVDIQQVEPESLTGGATDSRWQLVGFSTQATNGQAGILGMTMLCQADFPGSRMCTYEEIAGTTIVPALPALVDAWTQPIPVDLLGSGRGAQSCLNWSDAGGSTFGLVISEFGAARLESCDGSHSVACCAPR